MVCQAEKDLFLAGQVVCRAEKDLFLAGQVVCQAEKDLFLAVQVVFLVEKDLFLAPEKARRLEEKLDLVDNLPAQEALDVRDGDPHEALAGLECRPGDVGREGAAGGGEQRVVGPRGLVGEDVDPGPGEASGAEGVGQGPLVDQRPTARVDQDRRGLHQGEGLGVDEVGRLCRQRAMEGQDVALAKEAFLVDRPDAVGQLMGAFRGEGDDFHPESEGHACHGHPDMPQPDDAHRFPRQLEERRVEIREVRGAGPGARPVGARVVLHAVRMGQDMRENHLYDRVGAVGGDVGDDDAPLACRLEVDDVVARRQHPDVA